MWTNENRAKYNRDHLRYPSDLTDDEWAHVEPFIPPASRGLSANEIARALISMMARSKYLKCLPNGQLFSGLKEGGLTAR